MHVLEIPYKLFIEIRPDCPWPGPIDFKINDAILRDYESVFVTNQSPSAFCRLSHRLFSNLVEERLSENTPRQLSSLSVGQEEGSKQLLTIYDTVNQANIFARGHLAVSVQERVCVDKWETKTPLKVPCPHVARKKNTSFFAETITILQDLIYTHTPRFDCSIRCLSSPTCVLNLSYALG